MQCFVTPHNDSSPTDGLQMYGNKYLCRVHSMTHNFCSYGEVCPNEDFDFSSTTCKVHKMSGQSVELLYDRMVSLLNAQYATQTELNNMGTTLSTLSSQLTALVNRVEALEASNVQVRSQLGTLTTNFNAFIDRPGLLSLLGSTSAYQTQNNM